MSRVMTWLLDGNAGDARQIAEATTLNYEGVQKTVRKLMADGYLRIEGYSPLAPGARGKRAAIFVWSGKPYERTPETGRAMRADAPEKPLSRLPATAIVAQAIATQPALATMWAQPKEPA